MNQKTSVSSTETGNTAYVILLSAIAALGGFLFGFDSGVINGTVNALQQAFDADDIGTGFNVASMLLGCAAGAFMAGSLADKFGRRSVMILLAAIFIVSAWGSGISGSSAEFVFYRILGGLGVGGVSILAPAYISEIAPPKIRGRLASLQQLMIVIGLFSAFMSNYVIARLAGGTSDKLWAGFDAWQWMFWAEIIPASVFFTALFLIPESPRFLVAVNRADEAESILARMISKVKAKKLVEEIKFTVKESRKPRLSDILIENTRKVHPIIWIGAIIGILSQLTGINAVFYYGSVLWQAAGFKEADALFTNVINGSVNIAFTFLAIVLIDKVGRKPLLMTGALGQAVMLGVLAFIFSTGDLSPEGELHLSATQGIWALIVANAYIAFFATTWGPVLWTMLGEMFPNQFRGAALAVCGLLHWLSNFTVTLTFPVMLGAFGLGFTYGVYTAFGVLAFFFVKRFVKETKGRTLEEMSKEQKYTEQMSVEVRR